MPTLTEQQMHAAVAARDQACDGLFYYGVVTTGVFCRPSCSSKQARADNLRFFPSPAAAISAGFRSCKRCQPEELSPGLQRMVDLARYIQQHADQRLTLATLAERAQLSPSRLQRIFKEAFGVSPKAYQDGIRLLRYKQSLAKGDSVTDAIFNAGYGSVSRVYGEASRNIGMSPKAYRAGGAGETIHYALRESALGPMLMAATEKGVCFVQFDDDKDSLLAMLKREFPNAKLQPSSAQQAPELDTWMVSLDQHIDTGSPRPDLPLDMRGTAFQMQVWKMLLSVKEGEVLSYSELAQRLDKSCAVRAVASACGANKIGVLIPCHRILRSDGGLGGYRWGLERKRALLDRERQLATQSATPKASA
ncbi:MAG: bifunctional DNA-binding transcriptional regulator/O6-methylguanine-DNA methyltransferase Ada [Motiliproteus sp.]|nr:bifunctional DNA-binding transcriptional regulator/O6-methylguanine-DNA methyltransferase Ada [Motiliproteus sp.]